MEKINVYLDYSATTPISSEVYKEMLESFQNDFGNSASIHSYGRQANKSLEIAREKVAKILNAFPNEIYFTSGGTESNNWAIRGLAYANKAKGNHIITSAVEHPSVLNTCKALEKEGYEVTYLPVDKYGIVKYEELVKAITKQTTLITIMTANNEIGSLQPIHAIGKLAHAHGILFHTDAVQAINYIDIDVKSMDIDALSLSAHKIYAPKGVGVLYVKKGLKIDRLMYGGEQERNMRPGTCNVPGIVGLGKAIEIAKRDMQANNKNIKALRKYFINKVKENISNVELNGSATQCIPSVINLEFEGIEGESILMHLDIAGISVSTGSACASGSLEPSHVIKALGRPDEVAHSSIRFSIGHNTTMEELDYVIENLTSIVKKLRAMSPVRIKKNKVKGGK